MTFDKPEHKELVLDMINKVSVPGQLVELFYELKKAAALAKVEDTHHEPESTKQSI